MRSGAVAVGAACTEPAIGAGMAWLQGWAGATCRSRGTHSVLSMAAASQPHIADATLRMMPPPGQVRYPVVCSEMRTVGWLAVGG